MARNTPTKAVPASVASPFGTLVVEEAPPAKPTKATYPIDDTTRRFAEQLKTSAGPLLVKVQDWPDDLRQRFDATLRSNKNELFPDNRLRITKLDRDGQAWLRIALGAKGKTATV